MVMECMSDVWQLETPVEQCACVVLNNVIDAAMDGDHEKQDFLRKLQNGESWESIKEKLEVEGSTWYVWYLDGVHQFMLTNAQIN